MMRSEFIKKHGLTSSKNIQYGWVQGLFIVLRKEARRSKILQIYLCADKNTEIQKEKLTHALLMIRNYGNDQYGIGKVDGEAAFISSGVVNIRFFVPSEWYYKNISIFLDVVLPKLSRLEIDSGTCCAHCGEPLNGDNSVILFRNWVVPMHGDCVHQLERKEKGNRRTAKSGSVLKGAIGAFIAAVVCAMPWAVGYNQATVGFLIALLMPWIINCGYGLLGGKNSKVRVFVVLGMVVMSILLGQMVGLASQLLPLYSDAWPISAKDYLKISTECMIYDQGSALEKIYAAGGVDMSPEQLRKDRVNGSNMSMKEIMFKSKSAKLEVKIKELQLWLLINVAIALASGVSMSIYVLRRTMRRYTVKQLKSTAG